MVGVLRVQSSQYAAMLERRVQSSNFFSRERRLEEPGERNLLVWMENEKRGLDRSSRGIPCPSPL